MLIQLVLKIRDGMDSAVWRFLVLPIHIIMVQNVCVLIQEIIVSHGSIMMAENVFISLDHVQMEPNGMEHIVLLKTIVQWDFMELVHPACLYLKNVFLQLIILMEDVL